MKAVFLREVKLFFTNLTAYVALGFFFITSGVFLWVFESGYNILLSGVASLQPFFSLAPWSLLILIPAISMRMVAEDRRLGLLNLLLCRPISRWGIIGGKYLAGLVIILLALLPTLFYLLVVGSLASPAWNIDLGAIWGSYIGLFFLASAYLAIGLAVSASTDKQLVAFLLAILLSLSVFIVPSEIAALPAFQALSSSLVKWGMDYHYGALGRGVIDSTDVFYFLTVIVLSLLWAGMAIKVKKMTLPTSKKFTNVALVLVAVIFWIGLLQVRVFRLDMTEDKRYTLSSYTTSLLEQQTSPIHITCFLGGEIPPAFQYLRNTLTDKVRDMETALSVPLYFKMVDPFEVASEMKASKREVSIWRTLFEYGLEPVEVNIRKEHGEQIQKRIYPGVLVARDTVITSFNFLKNNQSLNYSENIHRSVEDLEYKMALSISRLGLKKRKRIGYLVGHGEVDSLPAYFTKAWLHGIYQVEDVDLQTADSSLLSYEMLLSVGASKPFDRRSKYLLDQYLVRGGKMAWFYDPTFLDEDELSTLGKAIALNRDIGLDDLFFNWGFRFSSSLLQDINCMQIPVKRSGNRNQRSSFVPWYYEFFLTGSPNSPITRHLGMILGSYVSAIDTLSVKGTYKSLLLSSGTASRNLGVPREVSLSETQAPLERALFSKVNIPVGWLAEGTFPSLFTFRPHAQYAQQTHIPFSDKSQKGMLALIADADMATGGVLLQEGQIVPSPPGYNRWVRITHGGNQEFIQNLVDYMLEDRRLSETRSRKMKRRFLDKITLREYVKQWQWAALFIPLLLVLLLGVLYNLFRKIRYAR